MGRRRRRRVGPTDDWEQLELLCAWEEQREYESIRPLVLFGEPVLERAAETSASERTLYRRIAGFKKDGMRSLFGLPPTKMRMLPPRSRRLIVDLKAEHPMPNLNEIVRICYVRAGRVVLDGQVAVSGHRDSNLQPRFLEV
jgi:putative transposase